MIKILSFILGLASLSPCVLSQNLKPALREVLSIGSADEDYFSQWAGIAVDATGAIYVVDVKDCRIRKFDASGRLIKEVGRKGQGPGEFDSPVNIQVHGDRLYVTQLYKPGFMIFDLELKYIGLLPAKYPISDFVVLTDGRILTSSIAPAAREGKKGSFLYLLNAKAELEKAILLPGDGSLARFDSWELALDGQGGVLAVDTWSDRIVKLDGEYRVLFLKRPLGIKTPKPKNLGTIEGFGPVSVPSEIVMKSVQFDSKNRAYILRGGMAQNPSRDVLIMDANGGIIGSLTLPEKSHLIYIDSRDLLYYRSAEGMTVKKAKIDYEPGKE